MMRPLFQRLIHAERGVALIVVLGTMMIFTISVTAAVAYSTANSTGSQVSKSRQVATALAEAGINNASAVLNLPSNNALAQATLPASEAAANVSSYEGGTAKWWGVLAGNTWTIHSIGQVANNPTARHKLTAKIQIVNTVTYSPNTIAWNFIYSKKTGDPDGCDEFINNSITLDTPIFVEGNLCLNNSVRLTQGPIVVKGTLRMLTSSSYVGAAGSPVSDLHVAGGCKVDGMASSFRTPCKEGLAPTGDNVWASTITSTPTVVTPPSADFAGWYADARTINHSSDCTTITGTPPTFDTNSVRDSSVTTTQNLTPTSSYTCRKVVNGVTVSELSWNNSTKTLTVAGTIFVDGSVRVNNGTLNRYDGKAALYVSGWFQMDSSVSLCAVDSGGNCSWDAWDPNTEMLAVVADGSNAGWGITMASSSNFQGAFYATYGVRLNASTRFDGPIVASEVDLTNSVTTSDFPTITSVPESMPATPNVHATPQPVGTYGG
jgi:Tfp pilus assembly protein PilV